MKKPVFILLALMAISAVTYAVAGCTGPNFSAVTSGPGSLPSGSSVTCCAVGDGSALSCTNGSIWFNAHVK